MDAIDAKAHETRPPGTEAPDAAPGEVEVPGVGTGAGTPRPEDWDARVERLSGKLPASLRRAVDWLREPRRVWLRVGAAILLMLGGVFSILPVLGLWMLPLGLALLAQDVPGLKVPLERAARWIERTVERLKARWRNRPAG